MLTAIAAVTVLAAPRLGVDPNDPWKPARGLAGPLVIALGIPIGAATPERIRFSDQGTVRVKVLQRFSTRTRSSPEVELGAVAEGSPLANLPACKGATPLVAVVELDSPVLRDIQSLPLEFSRGVPPGESGTPLLCLVVAFGQPHG